jgi:hypothetical protein
MLRNTWFLRLSKESHKQNPGLTVQTWREVFDHKYKPNPAWKPQPLPPPPAAHNDTPSNPQDLDRVPVFPVEALMDVDDEDDDDAPHLPIQIATFRSAIGQELPARSEEERHDVEPANWHNMPGKKYWLQIDDFDMKELGHTGVQKAISGLDTTECWDYENKRIIFLMLYNENWTDGERLLVPMSWKTLRVRNGQPVYLDTHSVRVWLPKCLKSRSKESKLEVSLSFPTSKSA